MAGTEENQSIFTAMGQKDKGVALSRRLELELETLILQKVEEVSSAIEAAKQVDQVICALHSLAVCLFPIDSFVVSDAIGSLYRNQVLAACIPTDSGRDEWRHVFYHGASFPAMSRILIYNVTSHWLGDFPFLARKQVYDSFFVEGPPSEIIQTLVPALKQNGSHNVISSNIESLALGNGGNKSSSSNLKCYRFKLNLNGSPLEYVSSDFGHARSGRSGPWNQIHI